jgi:hypothetical protein
MRKRARLAERFLMSIGRRALVTPAEKSLPAQSLRIRAATRNRSLLARLAGFHSRGEQWHTIQHHPAYLSRNSALSSAWFFISR